MKDIAHYKGAIINILIKKSWLKYCWNKEVIVYNRLSGDTHVLDLEMFNLLDRLSLMSHESRTKKIAEEFNEGSIDTQLKLKALLKLNLLSE